MRRELRVPRYDISYQRLGGYEESAIFGTMVWRLWHVVVVQMREGDDLDRSTIK